MQRLIDSVIPLLTVIMDASNEFRFISSPSNGETKVARDMGHSDFEVFDRNVPVCVTNSNRNLKLRFLWNKPFKLFQTHKTIYRAMSGITYNGYGTSLPGEKHKRNEVGCGSAVQRSQSHTDLHLGGRDSTGRAHCLQCGGCRVVEDGKAGSGVSLDEDLRKENRRRISDQKVEKRSSTSGVEKPKEQGDDGENHEQSFPSSTRNGDGNGNLCSSHPGNRIHYNCGCEWTSGGGRKKNHRLIPFQSVQLRRSQSQKHSRPPKSPCHPRYHQGDDRKFSHRAAFGQLELNQGGSEEEEKSFEPSPSNTFRQSNLTGHSLQRGRLEPSLISYPKYRHSYSPDSSNGQDDSGLDTWKSPGSYRADSIVCTISSQNNSPLESCGMREVRLLSEGIKTGVNDPIEPGATGMNTSVVQIRKSSESLDHQVEGPIPSDGEVDVECMSEIDLNSSSESAVEDETLSDLKMKFLTTGEGLGQFPPPVVLSYIENELDSLDLTLFETRRRDSVQSELTLQDLQSILGRSDQCECDSDRIYNDEGSVTSSAGRGIVGAGTSSNWSDAGSEFEFMGPPLPVQISSN